MPPATLANGNAAAADQSIDLPLFDVSVETPELGKRLVEAAARWGFLWIDGSPASENGPNHDQYDLDEKTVNRMFALSKEFFVDAPVAEKESCSVKHNRGWVNMHVENLDPSKHKRGDFKQAFNLSEPIDGDWLQPMPATFKRNEDELKDFHNRCRSLANRILRLLAMGLEIPDPNWLARSHEKSPNTSRFLYYPKLPADTDYSQQSDIRAGAHSDYGSITLLFQRPSQPGLELLMPNGAWAAVPIFPPNYHSTTFPPIVVNIGDLLSYWTNGLLRSTVHRVILTEQEKSAETARGEDRFSIAIFVQPHEDTELVAMPSPLVADRAAEFAREVVGHGGGTISADMMKTMTAGDHLSSRLQATYGAVYQREPAKVS